jgi:hypothetical protein
MLKELWKRVDELASQEYNRNLTSAGQCKPAHKYEDLESHHKIWFDIVTPIHLTDLV